MKKISALLALLAMFFAGLAIANTATVTSAAGSVQATTGTSPARALRVGDVVRQGDTVTTGAGSSVVLKFEDGQVAALTANSRLAVTAYQYNPQTQSGNVLLSLISGGMRAITGLIGRRTPDNVAYRAATATIGIRGTDITIVTDGGQVVVRVESGVISFQVGNQPPVVVTPGNAASLTADGIRTGPAAQIIQALPAALNVVVVNAQAAINALTNAISSAISAGTDTRVPPASTVNVQTTPAGGTGTSGPQTSCSAGFVLTANGQCVPAS